jgi:hypothetical protein|tara:strand:- start:273 stop:497 length:225 start_codon:yes stop_codon:yes gene_type:complete
MSKKGRKPVMFDWPDSDFTAEDIQKSLSGKLSRVSIHTKINNGLKAGEITLVKKVKPALGRPCSVYTRAKKVTT